MRLRSGLFFLFLLSLQPPRFVHADGRTDHHPARPGRTRDEPYPAIRMELARQFPGEIVAPRAQATVANGRVYIGSYSGRLHALDLKTGRELWTRTLDGPLINSAPVTDGKCFAATTAGSVYCLSASDGSPLWRARIGDHGFSATPAIVGKLLVLGSRGGTFYGIAMHNGETRWRTPIGSPIRTSAASDGKWAYFAAEDIRVRACDLVTGEIRWTSAPIAGRSLREYLPVVTGGQLVFRSFNGASMGQFDLRTRRWTPTAGRRVVTERRAVSITQAPTSAIPADVVEMPSLEDLAEYLRSAPSVARPSSDQEEGPQLDTSVSEALSGVWRPLSDQPGSQRSDLYFCHSAEEFEALLLAYPHVVPSLQKRIREVLSREMAEHPPVGEPGQYRLDQGKPREWSAVPAPLADKARSKFTPLYGTHALWLYASTLDSWEVAQGMLPLLREQFLDLVRTWPASIKSHSKETNRNVVDLLAFARIASRFDDPMAANARRMAAEGVLELITWMREYDPAKELTLEGGNVARLIGITSELAERLARYAPNHLRALLAFIDRTMPGWYLMGESPAADYPDQALAIYTARAAAGFDSREQLRTWLDVPFCRADLYDIEKRAIYLSRPDR